MSKQSLDRPVDVSNRNSDNLSLNLHELSFQQHCETIALFAEWGKWRWVNDAIDCLLERLREMHPFGRPNQITQQLELYQCNQYLVELDSKLIAFVDHPNHPIETRLCQLMGFEYNIKDTESVVDIDIKFIDQFNHLFNDKADDNDKHESKLDDSDIDSLIFEDDETARETRVAKRTVEKIVGRNQRSNQKYVSAFLYDQTYSRIDLKCISRSLAKAWISTGREMLSLIRVLIFEPDMVDLAIQLIDSGGDDLISKFTFPMEEYSRRVELQHRRRSFDPSAWKPVIDPRIAKRLWKKLYELMHFAFDKVQHPTILAVRAAYNDDHSIIFHPRYTEIWHAAIDDVKWIESYKLNLSSVTQEVLDTAVHTRSLGVIRFFTNRMKRHAVHLNFQIHDQHTCIRNSLVVALRLCDTEIIDILAESISKDGIFCASCQNDLLDSNDPRLTLTDAPNPKSVRLWRKLLNKDIGLDPEWYRFSGEHVEFGIEQGTVGKSVYQQYKTIMSILDELLPPELCQIIIHYVSWLEEDEFLSITPNVSDYDLDHGFKRSTRLDFGREREQQRFNAGDYFPPPFLDDDVYDEVD